MTPRLPPKAERCPLCGGTGRRPRERSELERFRAAFKRARTAIRRLRQLSVHELASAQQRTAWCAEADRAEADWRAEIAAWRADLNPEVAAAMLDDLTLP